MTKLTRCKTRGCKFPSFYMGLCRACLAPRMADPGRPIRYWPPMDRETATIQAEETRKGKMINDVNGLHRGGNLTEIAAY